MKNFIKNYLENRKKLKLFREKIKGIFDTWTVDQYCLEKGEYSLWISSGYDHFKDYRIKCKDNLFLAAFSQKERFIIWQEFQRLTKEGATSIRAKINQEFNL